MLSLRSSILLLVMSFFGDSSHAIGHGRPTSSHPEIIDMYFGSEICTGTLIGPHVVLSAGHCSGKFHFMKRNEEFDVQMIPHKSAVNWQSQESVFIKTNKYPANLLDISLGIVEKSIDAPYSTVISNQINSKKVFLYGYGDRKDNGFGGSGSTRLIRAKNKIFEFGELYFSMKSHLLFNRGTVLYGDSGGPTYNNDGIQVGVHSASNDKFSYDVRLDTLEAQSFLRDFIRQNNVRICGINLDCLNPLFHKQKTRTNVKD